MCTADGHADLGPAHAAELVTGSDTADPRIRLWRLLREPDPTTAVPKIAA